jgi:multidrug efflux pump subunit AcrA (membrane-fusion protein)
MIFPMLLLSLLLPATRAEAGGMELIQVRLRESTKLVHVLGRVMPGLGVLQSEVSPVTGRVTTVVRKEGQSVSPGTPLLRVSGPGCNGCPIQATHAGVVHEILKKEGDEVLVGEAIASSLNPSGLSIRLDVPSKYIKFVSAGQQLRVRFSQSPGTAYEVRISEILPAVGSGETTRAVRLESLAPPPGTGLDSLVNAEIPIPLGGSGIRVPATAVGFHRGRQFVVKKSGDRLEAVPIQILSESKSELWIRPEPGSPLKSGDSILATQAIFYLTELLEGGKD